jgi:S-adenosylmethionine:tRNA ribosyltransferase-isomerase
MPTLSPCDAPVAAARRLSDFDYHLPPELIAQLPAPARDAARLLVLDRHSGAVRHDVVRNLPDLLRAGDLLVFNDARVRRARLFGRTATGAAIELLLVAEQSSGEWRCLGRPAKRLRPGAALCFADGSAATVREWLGPGRYAVAFTSNVSRLLAGHGELPLPPYIKRPDGPLPLDLDRYQTVFAEREEAVAAPTAGLHFTPALLAALATAGVGHARLTLAVGPGTFLPVREPDVAAHRMEAEAAELPAATVEAIMRTKTAGGRVIAVGTTTTRALESAALRGESAAAGAPLAAGRLAADVFIVPGFRFRIVDALLTNFHLPCSTLLMLVSAFAGREAVLAAYAQAVHERYRFYSYGDAMLIA